MKLGFWNRLAVVLGIAALIVAPVGFWIERANTYGETKASLHEICMISANEAMENGDYETYTKEERACWNEFYGKPDASWPAWGAWWAGVQITGVVLVILYLLAAIIALAGKWIWRGRKINGSDA